MTGGCIKHNEELRNLYCSPNIRMVKLRMRWEGHVARKGEIKNAYELLLESLKGRNRSENVDIDDRTILKRILSKQALAVSTRFNWLGTRSNFLSH